MPAPKYDIIYRDLKEKIEDGIYPQGQFLPSEYTLIEEYHCSRNTVRRAIAQLADEGYVQSMHGKGVVVIWIAEQQSLFSIGSIESMREAAQRNHMSYHTKVIAFEEVTVDELLVERTGFAAGTKLWYVKRVRYFDGEALIIDTNWLDQSVVTDFTPELAQDSLYQYLEGVLGVNIVTSLRKLTVSKCDEIDREYLDLRDYNCVALVSSRTFNGEGKQFEYTESRHRPDRFVFYNQARRD